MIQKMQYLVFLALLGSCVFVAVNSDSVIQQRTMILISILKTKKLCLLIFTHLGKYCALMLVKNENIVTLYDLNIGCKLYFPIFRIFPPLSIIKTANKDRWNH